MNQRERLLAALAAQGKQSQKPMPKPTEAGWGEKALDFAGNIAPIAGGVIGGGVGALGLLGGPLAKLTIPAGAALGGGVGSLLGAGAHAGRDHFRGERDEQDREVEEEERRKLAKRQALLSLM